MIPQPMKTSATSVCTATVMPKAAAANAHSSQSFMPSFVRR